MAATTAPANKSGVKICWDFNTHLGRDSANCDRPHEIFRGVGNLTTATHLVLTKRGIRKHPKIPDTEIGDAIREIRKTAAADRTSKLSAAKSKAKQAKQ